uniref:Uncharacterized protein n=1 Tax=Grammatophora oceanica TaxID=210454 RepID=A0A6U5JFH5_9STRA|mmetsp:Transcript_24672/g.36220  ORF Transcript_24672/g.36220 Transcript_24672/m.36220 type:complete len:103 (+) Transcript_24672:89-397(+)|eukprot:CAMPEP_0194044224 /NCGR_PEP_ID=MMETSP0009_2-20130614/15717_1 /TAXON_ID=210454 /ORGANISM="Grammatophora oceanica, Strain CCMP 410" /LENGTH=102 /DNA_ID=CAMNT_0038688679 /DNA_START=82 /DNA_END=390 /DNA_ORIENTATION=-
MKTVQILLLAVVIACASAFVPSVKPAAFKTTSLAMSKLAENNPKVSPNVAALAAFATAMAPLAAHAEEIDEAVVIGYGAGLVACVVAFAVGFSVGYGTLVKP